MATKTPDATAPAEPAVTDADPEIDYTMVPGHPLCNYEKLMASQPLVDIYVPGDQQNPQHTHYRVSFNGYSREYPFNQTVRMPRPFAAQLLLGGRAQTSDVELRRSLEGQMARPHEGPIPGPFSGEFVSRI